MSALDDLEAGLPPELLVPGDIDSVEAAAAECQRIADKLADSRKNVDYIELRDGDWTGGAADVYFAVRDADVGVLQVSAEALQEASSALWSYASMLRDARRRAEEALEEYRTGKIAAEQYWTSTTVATQVGVPIDPMIVQASAVPDPAATTEFQDGPVRKLMMARDDVVVAGGAAAQSLERTREAAPKTPTVGTPPPPPTPGTPTDVWDTLETGVETFETTATTMIGPTAEVVPTVLTDTEAFAEGLAGDATAGGAGGLSGSAGTAALLSVLAMFGGAAAVAIGKHVRGPSALATSLPPGAFGERMAAFERSGSMPMTGTPVGQAGLGSAMRGAGGGSGSLGHSGSRGGSGADLSGVPQRRGRMRGFSTWLDEADLADDGMDDPVDPPAQT